MNTCMLISLSLFFCARCAQWICSIRSRPWTLQMGKSRKMMHLHKILWVTLMWFSMVRRVIVSQICATGKRNFLFSSVYVSNVNEYVYNIYKQCKWRNVQTCVTECIVYVPGHDPLTFFSCHPFSFLIGWEFYGPNNLKCWASSVPFPPVSLQRQVVCCCGLYSCVHLRGEPTLFPGWCK